MTDVIRIDNLKCGGCGSTIKKTLREIEGVEKVDIDFEKDEVSINHTEGVERQALANTLKSLGYPEAGTTSGFTALSATAKSYISCAIGRVNGDEAN